MRSMYRNEPFGSENTRLRLPNIGKVTKKIEDIGSRWPALGHLYSTYLYTDVVDREVELAGLKPGSSILHIGCGSLPFTALALAEKGYAVTGVDNDPASIAAARRFTEYHKPGADITFIEDDGASVDPSRYDAIWVSLNVAPKEEVLKNLLAGMREGGAIIYRNPREKRSSELYEQILPETFGEEYHHRRIPTDRVKEAVCMRRAPFPEEIPEGSSHISLENLGTDRPARIRHIPDYSLIPPLGLRPGKEVIIHCRHPMGGPIVLSVEGRRVALAREFARRIFVTEAEVTDGWISRKAVAGRA